jgi:hypothetical protein
VGVREHPPRLHDNFGQVWRDAELGFEQMFRTVKIIFSVFLL